MYLFFFYKTYTRALFKLSSFARREISNEILRSRIPLRGVRALYLQKKHMMTFDFDAMTGTPIMAYKKIQFNVLVGPIPKLKLMKAFPEALFPIFWVEDGIELGKVLVKPLKVAYRTILIAR